MERARRFIPAATINRVILRGICSRSTRSDCLMVIEMVHFHGVFNMPTDLGRKYSTDWRGRPPHMLAPDIPVWYRFLAAYSELFLSLWYDSFLGGPALSPEEKRDPMERMWRANTSKRTDAIAETEDEVWLIEVSDYPGMRALGQLMTYQTLWLEDPKIAKIERLVCVAGRIDQDIGAACAKFGIQLYIV